MTEHQSANYIAYRPDDYPVAVAQAMYHHVTGKTERIQELYRGAYTIDFAALENLHQKVKQMASRYHEGQCRCTVYLSLNKAESLRFTSFERFALYDASHPCATSNVNYVFDFLSVNKSVSERGSVVPERYKVVLNVDQDVELDDDNNERPFFLRQILGGKNIRVSLEYVDYTIARALLATVREWVEALPKRESAWIAKFVSSHHEALELLLPRVALACSLTGVYFFSLRHHLDDGVTPPSVKGLVVAAAAALLIYTACEWLTRQAIAAGYALERRTYLSLTTGDRHRRERIERKRAHKTAIFSFALSSVLAAILVNVLSTWLYQQFM